MNELKFKSKINRYLSLFGFINGSPKIIRKQNDLSDSKIFFLIWVKGLWTGVLISLVLHNFISH